MTNIFIYFFEIKKIDSRKYYAKNFCSKREFKINKSNLKTIVSKCFVYIESIHTTRSRSSWKFTNIYLPTCHKYEFFSRGNRWDTNSVDMFSDNFSKNDKTAQFVCYFISIRC